MKNYIISSVRPIRNGWHIEKNQDLYKNYQIMYDMSLASYRKFVLEPFESILLTDPVDDNYQYTLETWNFIRDLWHSEPCNIFWAGADTFMIQPTQIFGRFKEYRLFNYTDPRSFREFKNHFNNDVQYYPATMSEETWKLGQEYWDQADVEYDLKNWGLDQLRHNAMFWSQDIRDDDRLHPYLNYMCHGLRSPSHIQLEWTQNWNSGLEFNRAHVLHFCASRGSDSVIQFMRMLCSQLEVEHG